ncbi:quinone oxidoreductase-like [Teratosphaeria destructans]|uniref:Quinone oxidoreductase-like n=1 Tax=Teratosphaeria destructans TaxID=418781 RepID=A0A9W7SZ20_9PEZI|nr:quinone oxidoreductase-like [Teratosphaeria destructans]
MQAIHISPDFATDVSSLLPSDVPKPSPETNEFVIRITHCSPQHADILHAQGKHQNNNRKKGWCFPPFILGFDFAGTIESLPEDEAGGVFRKGDRVFGASIGAFAEHICVPKERIRKIPDGLSAETACAMSGQAVSYASVVNIAKVQSDETVMVSGASGGLGSVCCMVAEAVGARVIALAGDESKASHMRRESNFDYVIVLDAEGKWKEDVMRFTDGKGVDVFLDNIGMVNEGLRCMAYFGRIVILGFAARKGVMEDVKMNKLLLKSITVTGYRFGESGRRHPDELQRIWDGYLEMLASGRLRPMLYGKYDGLKDVGRALKDLEERKVYGKVVISVAAQQDCAKL